MKICSQPFWSIQFEWKVNTSHLQFRCDKSIYWCIHLCFVLDKSFYSLGLGVCRSTPGLFFLGLLIHNERRGSIFGVKGSWDLRKRKTLEFICLFWECLSHCTISKDPALTQEQETELKWYLKLKIPPTCNSWESSESDLKFREIEQCNIFLTI